MDQKFFDDLGLPEPRFSNDTVKNYSTHGGQTAEMIKAVEDVCIKAKPSAVIVGGDANTNFAAAVAVRKLVAIDLAHMEAGLRSHDWQMPEEHNRVMIDHISDMLFTPTEQAKANLLNEKVKGEIHYSGNTIVDAVQQNLLFAQEKSNVQEKIGDEPFILLTMHREENVDHKNILRDIFSALREVKSRFGLRIIYPCHPRTSLRLGQFDLKKQFLDGSGIELIEPLGYLDFLMMMSKARLIMTDSGGIQEEACILKVPCVTLRENTERPETLVVGSNILAGTKPENIFKSIAKGLELQCEWENPYGDGKASKRIADVLINRVKI